MNICSDEVTMSSVQNLRELINERLTAAAEEIFTEFEKTIVQYEEEIDCQSRLLDNIWKPQITQHTAALPQQHVCKEEKVLTDNQLNNQEMMSSLDTEPPQIKVEQEELCNSLESQQLAPSQETHAFMLVQCKSKCKELSGEIFRVFEKTLVQYEEKFYHQRRLLDVIWTPKMKLQSMELTQQHVCIEEDIIEQRLCNQEMKSSLDHKDSKPPQIKEEQEDICTSVFQDDTELVQIKEEQEELCTSVDMEEPDHPAIKEEQEELCTSVDQVEPELPQIKEEHDEVCTSQEGEQLVLKQKFDIFVVIPICEEVDQNRRNSSLSKNIDNCAVSEGQFNTDNTEEKSVKCGICGKTFKSRCSLKKHHLSHTSERPYSCGICGKPFKSRCYLKKHYLSHTSEKPYTCETCGKCFNRSGSLKRHMVTHAGEKQYRCDICGKNFTLNRSLKVHMRLHTGEKPYSCETCGKSFTLSHGLKVHMRSHTAEKPYPCEECGKSFVNRSHLRNHMMFHTGEKPYSCTTCGKRFSQQSALRTHIRIHTGEKPFSCKSCGRSFNRSGILLRHMRTHTDKSQSGNSFGN
ncbi:zinc finger protein 239-like isoform X5 [Acanthochromis polyacanthus]|uniref:zinc finger protein 239-like isoform X5 n=1 Tax=Acanthochromis polyacanthus TaxID=80966 RepID=UPI0022348749|nr:zinc finger protein 239-like isoform X5 [Acanthochromis polyacanthus]